MPPNPDQIAADWKARGFSCEMWTDPPGQFLDCEVGEYVETKAQGPKVRHFAVSTG